VEDRVGTDPIGGGGENPLIGDLTGRAVRYVQDQRSRVTGSYYARKPYRMPSSIRASLIRLRPEYAPDGMRLIAEERNASQSSPAMFSRSFPADFAEFGPPCALVHEGSTARGWIG
jgi:hypothetical protein